MAIAIYLPLLAALSVGLSAPWLARQLPPATATRLLCAGAAVTALACAFSLGVLAFLLVADIPAAAALGHWSVSALRADNDVPLVASAGGAVAALAVSSLLATVVWRQVRSALRARAYCDRIGGEPGRLVVLDSERVDAFSLSARRGRIVVTRPLLRGLSGTQRRALLAHEHAHLDCHHHRYRAVVSLAVALCPLLGPARRAVDYATERWADEVAADRLRDRSLVATTLVHSSILSRLHPIPDTAPTLPAVRGSVVRRVQALLRPAPPQRPLLVMAVVAVLVLALSAALDVRADTEHLLEAAFNAWPAGA